MRWVNQYNTITIEELIQKDKEQEELKKQEELNRRTLHLDIQTDDGCTYYTHSITKKYYVYDYWFDEKWILGSDK